MSEGDVPVWRVLLDYVRPFRLALAGGAVLSLASSATGLALPLVVRELVTGLGSRRGITGLLVLMAVLALTNAAIGAAGDYLLERTAESVVLLARRRLVSRLLRLRIAAVDRTEPGDLMSRVTSDTTLLRMVTTRSLVSAVTGALAFLAALVIMALLDPLLLGVTVGVLALAQVIVRTMMPRIRAATRQAQESVGAMGAALERVLGALRTVKASGAEARERERLHEAAAESWRGGIRAARWEAIAGSTGGLAMQTSFIVVLGLGGARVVSGAIDVGTLIAFLLYLSYLIPPMRDLINAVANYQVGSAAVARIREVETLPTEPDHPQADREIPVHLHRAALALPVQDGCSRVEGLRVAEEVQVPAPRDAHLPRAGDRPRRKPRSLAGDVHLPGRALAAGAFRADQRPKRFVIGSRRSRPKARVEILIPGGAWRRLYSARSTNRITRSTSSPGSPWRTSCSASRSPST